MMELQVSRGSWGSMYHEVSAPRLRWEEGYGVGGGAVRGALP